MHCDVYVFSGYDNCCSVFCVFSVYLWLFRNRVDVVKLRKRWPSSKYASFTRCWRCWQLRERGKESEISALSIHVFSIDNIFSVIRLFLIGWTSCFIDVSLLALALCTEFCIISTFFSAFVLSRCHLNVAWKICMVNFSMKPKKLQRNLFNL